MAYLLSFDPAKELDYKSTIDASAKATEKELFEAFYIAYTTTDSPGTKDVRTSLRLEADIKDKSVEGGTFKLSHCSSCGTRVAVYDNTRSITEKFDLILDKAAFDYIKSCINKWEHLLKELRPHVAELLDRFENMKDKSIADWQRFLGDRDAE